MSIKVDYSRVLRETRWRLLQLLHLARPQGADLGLLWRALTDQSLPVTHDDIRRELTYLRDHDLVTLMNESRGDYHAKLTATGVDVTEYNRDVPAGIDRPPYRGA